MQPRTHFTPCRRHTTDCRQRPTFNRWAASLGAPDRRCRSTSAEHCRCGPDGQVIVKLVNLAAIALGGNFKIDQIVLSGQLAPDHKTLGLAITQPALQTQTTAAGAVRYRVCQRSDVLVKVGP